MKENEFVDISEYGGVYQINRLGEIKALKRIWFSGWNYSIKKEKEEHILKQVMVKGYLCVPLTINGFEKAIKVHRLVAKAFIENSLNKLYVNHLNGNKSDNRVENLEWCTAKENAQHAVKNGLIVFKKGIESHLYGKRGELVYNHKLVLDTQSGIFYFGVREAADAKCINRGTLKDWLIGRYKNKSSLIYV